MCGIAGIVRITPATDAASRRHALTRPHAESIPESWLDTLDQSIRQRGPDGQGRFRDRAARADGTVVDVAFVHRRLSILDHGGGRQPMLAPPLAAAPADTFTPLLFQGQPDQAVHYQPAPVDAGLSSVVFNGCIYNHRALRPELQSLGHRFASDHSDTEVLLHGSRQWGESLPDHLDGMFAYAVWSGALGEVHLARDTAGEKPLYYAVIEPGITAFASSPAGICRLLSTVQGSLRFDLAGVMMWLKHGYWPTMPVAGLHEVAPGCGHRIEFDGPTPARRTAPLPPTPGVLDANRVESLLQAAIESRLDADVPIGCFLSGGVDSSIVAAVAHRAMQQRGRKLRTFTVRMPDPRMDETPFANAVAAHLGTDHAVLDCRHTAAADLVALITQLGLPFGDSSLLPTHWVSAAARTHATVALGGDGGDELFAGYDRYFAQRAMHRLRGVNPMLRALPEWCVRPLGGNLARVTHAARNHGYHDILTIFRTPQLRRLCPDTPIDEVLNAAYAGRAVAGDARHEDFAHYLPEDLMRKVDTASMAVALEVRAPLLSRPLVAAALGAPMTAVEAGEGRKGLLRQVARRLAPAEAIDRRKQGFGAPIGRWIRSDFGGLRTLLNDRLRTNDPFGPLDGVLRIDRREVVKMVDDHLEGRADHPQRLYMLLSLAVWAYAMA